MKKVALVLTALVCGLFGIMLGSFAIEGLVAQESARSWPTTAGVVRSEKIHPSNGRMGLHWCVSWSYEYTINGKIYTGDRRTFGAFDCHRRRKNAENEAHSLPVGTRVVVFYQPEAPSNATLSATSESSFLWWLFVAVAAAFVTIAVLIVFQSKKLDMKLVRSDAKET
ncbi:DUF3592 domain-containing protein [uncultured Xylophilus sp.]|uniref:DUF3592 domain-containing protein n=1 Tax=uncultured Xylophilus sp. TaxID=296832 RepID=UPI0025EBA559|nr:DUF3592 domain-containing protein [uncultured Xylophilus sp.]